MDDAVVWIVWRADEWACGESVRAFTSEDAARSWMHAQPTTYLIDERYPECLGGWKYGVERVTLAQGAVYCSVGQHRVGHSEATRFPVVCESGQCVVKCCDGCDQTEGAGDGGSND